MVADLDAAVLTRTLLAEQLLGQRLFHVRRDEDATFGMLGMGATMDTYTCPTGYLV